MLCKLQAFVHLFKLFCVLSEMLSIPECLCVFFKGSRPSKVCA